MKKVILFSLASIICLTLITKVNAMQWLIMMQKIKLHNDRVHCGFKAVLSNNASLKQFHKKQNDVIRLSNIDDFIEHDYEENPSDFHSDLHEKIAELYVKTFMQQEELAPRQYNIPRDHERYQNLINDLKYQLHE